MRVTRSLFGTACATLLLSGCMVGPKYVKPAVPTAPSYKEAPVAYKEDGAWRTAQPADALPKGEWWTLFQDGGLNTLEPQILTSNQNVRIADANLQREPVESLSHDRCGAVCRSGALFGKPALL